MRSSGFGKHVQQTSAQDNRNFWLFLYISEIIYPISIAVTKISMLLLYWSIFQVTSFKMSVAITGIIVAGWAFATVCHLNRFKSSPKSNYRCLLQPCRATRSTHSGTTRYRTPVLMLYGTTLGKQYQIFLLTWQSSCSLCRTCGR